MATEGLKGIWGLEQLDRTGIATWKLAFLLMGAGVLIGLLLIPVLGNVNPDSPLVTLYTPKTVGLAVVMFCWATGFNAFAAILLARYAEADFRLFLEDGSVTEDSVGQLQPTKTVQFSSLTVIAMMVFLTLPFVDMFSVNLSFAERFSFLHASGLVLNVIQYLLLPINGITASVLISILVSQYFGYVNLAKSVRIDLLQLDRYTTIANPAVRLVILVFTILSLMPPMMLFIQDATFTDG